jgi:hypothetical protein
VHDVSDRDFVGAKRIAERTLPAVVRRRLLFARNRTLRSLGRIRALRSRNRSMPHFLIIGGQRCGTTQLYNQLTRADGVRPALVKEVHFFDDNFDLGEEWYRSFFPVLSESEITGEATPMYFTDGAVPERVAAMLPEVRLIALLRDPVVRMLSQYHHERRLGLETRTFEDVVASELGDRLSTGGTAHRPGGDYMHRSSYAQHIMLWQRWFPRDHVLVIRSEDYYTRPHAVLGDVCRFIGVPAASDVADRPPKQFPYPLMDPTIEQQLRRHFDEPNRQLANLLGWSETWPTAAVR